MMIQSRLYAFNRNTLFTLLVSVVLAACSTEEDIPGVADLAGGAGIVEADDSTAVPTPTPTPTPAPAPAPVPPPMPVTVPEPEPEPEPEPGPEPVAPAPQPEAPTDPVSNINTPAIITGTSSRTITEDVDPDRDGLLETSGKLNVVDSDAGESAFAARSRRGQYGTLSITASGAWNYAAANSQIVIQSLADGGRVTDTIQVSSIDGTTQNVVIRINGADDASVISGATTGHVTEDVDPDGDNLLEITGKLTISDPDSGDAVFNSTTTAGLYGSLTINASGRWRYAANNNQAAIQNLNAGATIRDTLTVRSVRGVTQDVVITIAGADEANIPAELTLSWVAPIEREDGMPISMAEIAGYRVYYGTAIGNYTNQVEVADRSNMQVTLRNLDPGTYYFVVTAYDTDGRESGFSSVVSRSL